MYNFFKEVFILKRVEKIKVQINLNADMVEKIDKYADKIGMTRSGLCSYWIGQGFMSMDLMINAGLEAIRQQVKVDVESGK